MDDTQDKQSEEADNAATEQLREEITKEPRSSTVSAMTEKPTATTTESDTDNSKKSAVSFGTVRVHQHRLTLGDNPGVSTGVPLTLGWDVEDSETYDLQSFERNNASEEHKLSRITRGKRELIASEHHSRGSILQRGNEVREIKKSRETSVTDRAARRHNKKKHGGGICRWFHRK